MAKKGNKGLRQGLAAINRLGDELYAEADADFVIASSALTAGNRGLSRQLGRIERAADNAIALQQRGLRRGVAAARAGQRAVRVDQARTINRYGGALAASAASQYGQAGATAAAGTAVARGQAGAGRSQGKVADVIQGIAREGAAAQASAAEYALGQAMQQRAIVDNQTLASLTGQLYQTALQYNMQWDLWKRQQDYALKQTDKAQNQQLKSLATTLPSEMPGIAQDALADYAAAWEEDPETVSVSTLLQSYADTHGYAGNEPQLQVYAATVRNMLGQNPNDINPATAATQAVTSLWGSLPGWDRYGEPILASVEAGTFVAGYISVGRELSSGASSTSPYAPTGGSTLPYIAGPRGALAPNPNYVGG